MLKLNPAVRTGLIWAGVHQVLALYGLVSLWMANNLFPLFGVVLLLTDLPTLMLGSALGLETWHPRFLSVLRNSLPGHNHRSLELFCVVLTVGALQ